MEDCMRIYAVIFLSLLSVASGQTWIVSADGSGDFTSIQEAIYESWHGDTITVKPGVYTEDIIFAGRQITLTSENPDDPNVVAATILDGSITFFLGETQSSILQGFTIRGRVFPLSLADHQQTAPKIHGTTVVWQDKRNYDQSGWDIYGMDLTTGQEFAVCVADSNQVAPDVYDDRVVWQDYRNDPNWADIYGLTLSTMQEFVVAGGPHDESAPAIDGDTVVWQDNRGGAYDIYGKNLTTSEELIINTSANDQLNPAISDVVVVWQDYRSGSRYDIFAKNIQTGSSYVVSNVVTNKINPAISSAYIVWQDYRNGNADIYGKSRTTNQDITVTTAGGSQMMPAIFEDIVLWEDYSGGSADIYSKNLTTSQQTVITSASGAQTLPAVFENRIVWTDTRWGTPLIVYMDTARSNTYSILCSYSDPTIQKNVITTTEHAIVGQYSAAPDILSNSILLADMGISNCHGPIEENVFQLNTIAVSACDGQIEHNLMTLNDTAISACDGTISANTVSFNNAAISNCGGLICENQVIDNSGAGITSGGNTQTEITGNYLFNNANGITNVTAASISENIISLNQGDGIVNCTAAIIRNNIISQNTGFGINTCTATIRNNTVIENGSTGIKAPSGQCVRNNIITDNGGFGVEGGTISYNCLWANSGGIYSGSVPAPGNIVVNPLFADAENGDYHLKSQIGRFDPNTEQWITDTQTSRCIDAADPNDSTAQEPNPNGGRLNMGAFGGTPQASLSANGDGEIVPVCENKPDMDFDNDCKVGLSDFVLFAQEWLLCGLQPQDSCN